MIYRILIPHLSHPIGIYRTCSSLPHPQMICSIKSDASRRESQNRLSFLVFQANVFWVFLAVLVLILCTLALSTWLIYLYRCGVVSLIMRKRIPSQTGLGLSLQGNIWEEHGKAVAEATPYLPGSFNRPPRNIADKINSGYKAWEWLLYLYGFPALLYGVLPQPYYSHFCKLVCAMRIIQQHNIKTTDLIQAEHLL